MDNNADKRIVLGSDGPCEGVATSLRFPSKSGSFTLDSYGKEAGPPDEQPDSPIKTSPVSERIKALEALVAQRNQPDFRSDRGFFHVRDYHSDKFPIEKVTPSEKMVPAKITKEVSGSQPSPDSPPDILGDLEKMNEFEETEEWMKAHLPPVPTFDAVDLMKLDDAGSAMEDETEKDMPDDLSITAVDSGVDSPVDLLQEHQTQPRVEEKSEVDLGSLPPAYQSGQTDVPVAELSIDSNSATEKPTCGGNGEPPEASEAESSGESDDTVIEDGVPVHSDSSNEVDGSTMLLSTAVNPTELKDIPPPPSERKLMQVPTINVIETDEQQYSDGEMELELEEVEDYDEVVKEQCPEAPKSPEADSEDSENEASGVGPPEPEFMEVYSPPSSPAGSDAEHSPVHKMVGSLSESSHQEVATKSESLFEQTISAPDLFQAPCGNKDLSSKDEKGDFGDNDNEWSEEGLGLEEESEEAQDLLVKNDKTDAQIEETSSTPYKVEDQSMKAAEEINVRRAFVSRASLIQEDFYERQSFDSDYSASPALDCIDCTKQSSAKERFLSGSSEVNIGELSSYTVQNEASEEHQNIDFISGKEDEHLSKADAQAVSSDSSQDLNSSVQSDAVSGQIHEQDRSETSSPDIVCEKVEDLSLSELKNVQDALLQDTEAARVGADTRSTDPTHDPTHDPTGSKNPDSFVDFMRECLKSQQDEEVQDEAQSGESLAKKESVLPSSQSTPTVVMDLEQEQLTISLLKGRGISKEEEPDVPGQEDASPTCTPTESSSTPRSKPARSQSDLVLDTTYSKGVEAFDQWVAEAYHLTEHVLTAILTHLSGNTSLWL